MLSYRYITELSSTGGGTYCIHGIIGITDTTGRSPLYLNFPPQYTAGNIENEYVRRSIWSVTGNNTRLYVQVPMIP
jgi:hypothetical protein